MGGLTIQLQGEDAATLDDMGDGTFLISQHSEVSGRMERTVLDLEQVTQLWKAACARYGREAKNTEPLELELA